MAHLSVNERRYIERELIAGVHSKQDIADALGCSLRTIYYVIDKHLTPIDGSPSSLQDRPREGYRKLSAQQVYELEQYLLDHPFRTNQQIVHDLELLITPRSIVNYLNDLGYATHVAEKKPLINLANLGLRRDWAEKHENWTKESWRKVIFTDESTFQNYCEGRVLVKRPRGRRYDQRYIANFEAQSRIKRNFFGVMVFGKPVQLFEATDNMDAAEFNRIVSDQMLPYLERLGVEDAIVQIDNAGVHNEAGPLLRERGFRILDWCPKMCDVSPIENIWGIGKRKKNQLLLNKTFSSQAEFDQSMKDTIRSIPIEVVNRLYDSLPDRVHLLKESRGKAIRF